MANLLSRCEQVGLRCPRASLSCMRRAAYRVEHLCIAIRSQTPVVEWHRISQVRSVVALIQPDGVRSLGALSKWLRCRAVPAECAVFSLQMPTGADVVACGLASNTCLLDQTRRGQEMGQAASSSDATTNVPMGAVDVFDAFASSKSMKPIALETPSPLMADSRRRNIDAQ
jgi:hypothetical protein